MTTNQQPESSFEEKVLQALAELKHSDEELKRDFEQLRTQMNKNDQRLTDEVKRWDERFFQLSRDTLSFTRAVVTTAAVVAVIVPIFRDLIPVLVEQFAKP
jgi:hypothetical protein